MASEENSATARSHSRPATTTGASLPPWSSAMEDTYCTLKMYQGLEGRGHKLTRWDKLWQVGQWVCIARSMGKNELAESSDDAAVKLRLALEEKQARGGQVDDIDVGVFDVIIASMTTELGELDDLRFEGWDSDRLERATQSKSESALRLRLQREGP